jgi:hypothetical protein
MLVINSDEDTPCFWTRQPQAISKILLFKLTIVVFIDLGLKVDREPIVNSQVRGGLRSRSTVEGALVRPELLVSYLGLADGKAVFLVRHPVQRGKRLLQCRHDPKRLCQGGLCSVSPPLRNLACKLRRNYAYLDFVLAVARMVRLR